MGSPSSFLYVYSICACLVLSVSSSSWCLGRATVCDCGTPCFLLPFFFQFPENRKFVFLRSLFPEKVFINRYIFSKWQMSWDRATFNKLHEIKPVLGKNTTSIIKASRSGSYTSTYRSY